jgi:hypothetical protein
MGATTKAKKTAMLQGVPDVKAKMYQECFNSIKIEQLLPKILPI